MKIDDILVKRLNTFEENIKYDENTEENWKINSGNPKCHKTIPINTVDIDEFKKKSLKKESHRQIWAIGPQGPFNLVEPIGRVNQSDGKELVRRSLKQMINRSKLPESKIDKVTADRSHNQPVWLWGKKTLIEVLSDKSWKVWKNCWGKSEETNLKLEKKDENYSTTHFQDTQEEWTGLRQDQEDGEAWTEADIYT